MGSKRANGEGTIRKKIIKGNEYWEAICTNGYDKNGKQKKKSFYGKTQGEALSKMREFLRYVEVAPNANNITFGQWYYTYLFEFRKQDLKPSSFERYYGIYTKYIKSNPKLSNCQLSKLKTATIQSYYNTLLNEGSKPSTIQSINRFFRSCLNEAVKQDYIIKNPCVYVTLPKDNTLKEDNEKVVFLTKEEQDKFITAIKGHKNETLFLLDLGTGLREGELLGLKWSDIDLKAMSLKVNRSIKRVPVVDKITNKARTYEIVEQTPKTKNSVRVVPIPIKIVAALKKHKHEQNKIKIENKDVWNDNNYVFCNDVGNPLDSKQPLRQFQSILKKINIQEMKFHALRHTYATRLFENGVEAKTVQMLLGHSDITTTLDTYVHVTQDKKIEAIEKINCLF